MSWLSRFKNALRPRRLDEDLAAEMADHLERRAAALRAKGLGSDEALRQARMRFGNVTRLREESRGFRLWETPEGTLQDLRYAWRGMRKGPAFAITAVLSLALAIGANTAIYSIVDAAILRPLPVPEPDNLFLLSYPDISEPGTPAGRERESFSYPMYSQFAAITKPAARLVLVGSPFRAEVQGVNSDAPVEKANGAFISGDGFEVLGVRPAAGRLFSAEDDRISQGRAIAVLSYGYWQKRYHADPAVVGRFLKVQGKAYEITGVAREGFFGVEPGKFVDVWLPATQYDSQALTDIGWHWFRILGRLAPGYSPGRTQARLQPAFHDFQVQSISQFRSIPAAIRQQFLQSVIRVHPAPTGVSDLRAGFSRPLWIVFGVAAGILLIACANVASLLLARSTARAPEMAMRVSLGAARARLIRQMLSENLFLSLVAGGLGWLLARIVAPLLVGLLSTQDNPAQFVLAIDTRVLLFCISVSTVSAALFGLVPAWQASGIQPMLSLRVSAGQARRIKLGKVFVSIQVACAFCLVLVGAAFLFSLGNLLRVDPGFEARNVAVLNITAEAIPKSGDPVAWNAAHPGEQERLRNLMVQLQARVANQPGVQAAALAWWPIFQGGGWSQQVILPGKGPSDREEIFYRVSPGYFAALRTPLIAGRDFQPADSAAREPTPAIVNEAFARRYFNGSQSALGREFSYPFGKSVIREVIVGVAADAHYYDLRKLADPIAYLPIDGNNGFTLYVRSSLNLGSLTRLVEREARAAGSGTRVREITTLETLVGNTLLREKLLAGVGGTFAGFGLLLAAVGLFGLLSYSVGRRTKEIGIRAALGARRGEIVSLVLRDVSALIGAGLIVGLTAALAVMALFRSLLFGIQKADPLVIGTAIGLFLLTGLVAACLPAHRAATLDPVSALREE
jgi:predicted permease